MRSRLLVTTCLTAMFANAFMPHAHANPVDGTVSAGSATITANGKTLDITQQSDKAVIDWRGFDIDADETTNFYQPSSSSITVNRVHSSQASAINGHLNANGNVVIINQNGIVFGANAQVDVHGIVATTSDVDNDRFMNENKVHFDLPGNTSASIVNNGTITAHDAGLVGFVAPNVENNGTITANLGRVHLASGDKATVDFYGDGLMEVEASDDLQNQIVTNRGAIDAAGGKIALTAAAGGNVVNSIINAQGQIHAQSVGVHNGQIVISAAGAHKTNKTGSSRVNVAGSIDASGLASGSKGGAVTITADNIVLDSTARILASGDWGGGAVKIGGDYHGEGSTQTTKNLTVMSDAQIFNDAITSGDGGNTVLWSDGITYYAGRISARGGAQNGKGGFVEVSGHDFLKYDGLVDLAAKNEDDYGTLLLDPTDITISSGADSGGSFSAGVYTPVGASSVINTATLVTQINAANVTISTTSAGAGSGDITFANALTWTTASRNLTLVSTRDILINAAITAAATSNITMTAGRDIVFAANVTTSTGGIDATAARDLTVNAGATLRGGIQLKAANNVITNTGVLTLNGALQVVSATFTLTSGLDSGGNRVDLTLDGTNMSFTGGTSTVITTVTGFRDINLNRSWGMTGGSNNIQAERNLTIGSGATITSGTSNPLTLRAAGNNIANTGIFTNNGVVSIGTSVLTIVSGLDSGGNRADLTLTGTNFSLNQGNTNQPVFSGFRDINLNTSLTFNAATTLTAIRNLTIGTGATITSGAATALTLRAANNVTTGTGTFTNSGTINIGTAALTLVTGVDGSGNKVDITFDNASLTLQGANTTGTTLSGFQDINLNRNIAFTGATTITAGRHLTIGSGATITNAGTGLLSLNAGTGSINVVGVFTNNGTINLGTTTSGLTIVNGLTSPGVRTQDVTFTSSNLTFGAATMGSLSVTGFRDINVNQSFSSTSTVNITAERHLTIGAGATLGVANGGAATLRAAAANTANVGIFTNNGTVNAGTSALTLLTGLDNSSARTIDITLTTGNLTFQGATSGGLTLSGFRDINLNRNMTFSVANTITANRDLTIGAGATIASGAATTMNLQAAGNVSTNTGVFTNNGTMSIGTAALTLMSGLDSGGNRVDITFDNSTLTLQGANTAGIAINGFRDVTVNRNITFNAAAVISGSRNVTIGAGVTVASGAATALSLIAAGNVITNTGVLTNNGTISMGTGVLTLFSGLDTGGSLTNLNVTSSYLTFQGANTAGFVWNGFNDITIGRSVTFNTAASITALRDFTIGAGATITSGGAISFSAAGNTNTNTGIFTNNGVISMGNAALTLLSGLDSGGNRVDLTLNSSNFNQQVATMGTPLFSGFRDINLNTNMAINGATSLTAFRNITIGAGATISMPTNSNLSLRAANNSAATLGYFTNNGVLSVGTGTLTLVSGVDGSSVSNDITFTGSNFTMLGATIGSLTLTGFRDINLNTSMAFSAATTITALRNLTIGSGATITSGAATALTLNAANNAVGNTGIFTNNGTINQGSSTLTILSGLDGSGNKTDITLTTGNLTMQGAAIGGLGLTGFRDVFFNRTLSTGAVTLTAARNITIGAGTTLTSASMSLSAAGASTGGTGSIYLNGAISVNSGAFVLLSGFDSTTGLRNDLTLNNTNYTQGALSSVSISGFRDITFGQNVTATSSISVVAERNITVNSGTTLQAGTANIVLNAASGVTTNTGIITINGALSVNTGTFALTTGLDSGGNRLDLDVDATHFIMQGAVMGAPVFSGYRDITLSRNLNFNQAATITAIRNLTVATGVTISTTGALALTLNAAGAIATNTGTLTINGTVNQSTGNLTLMSGLDGSGNKSDLTLTTSNLTFQGAAMGLLTLTGWRDVNLNRNITFNANSTITAGRNLTIGAGTTIASGAANNLVLNAAGGVATVSGVFTNNGTVSIGTGALTIVSGLDGSSNKVDVTMDTSTLNLQTGTTAAMTLTGFRDITLNRSMAFSVAQTFTANRSLTIGASGNIAAGNSQALTLNAAAGVITNQGLFTNNGVITASSGALTILSGLDLSGQRTNDITFNNTNLAMSAGAIGSTTITGFRDITFASNYISNSAVSVTAERNLTINSGVTVYVGTSASGGTFRAAGANIANVGVLTLNGAISMGTGTLTLLNGQDSAGVRTNDLTLNGTNIIIVGGTAGHMTMTGYRDITFASNYTSGGTITAVAERNMLINTGVTLTSGATGTVVLRGAGGVATNTGTFINNGVISVGTSNLILFSGLDSGGNKIDLTLDNTNFIQQGANVGVATLTGFRDLNLNRSLTTTGTTTITAARNLTIGTGATIGGSALTLYAAGAVVSATGIFTNNGTISIGNGGSLTLLSGLDSGGNRVDITLDNSTLSLGGTALGLSLSGFRDIALNKTMIINNTATITAARNISIGAGAVLGMGNGVNIALNAANNVISGTGTFINNGQISMGNGGLTLTSGLDSGGNRVDLTLDNTTFATSGAMGALTLSGFRDINLNKSITLGANSSVIAQRNLTIATGTTFTSSASGSLTFSAAGGTKTNIGMVIINGTLALGTGTFSMASGLDLSGQSTNDLILTTSNLALTGANIGNMTVFGFRDITIARDLPATATFLTAERNMTINAGVTVTTGPTGGTNLKAAGGVITNSGVFTNNGTISQGTGGLTLLSGLDGSGNYIDLTLDSSNLTFQGATISAPNLTGFRDINLNRNIAFGAAATIQAIRNINIASGVTISTSAATALSLLAANNVSSGIGVLNNLGTISVGTLGALTTMSGVDGSGNRIDATINNTYLAANGAIGNVTMTGFRNLTLDRDLTSSGNYGFVPVGNFTLASGRTLTSTGGGRITITASGLIVLNGQLVASSAGSALNLSAGADTSGNRGDLILSTSNFYNGATVGGTSFTGFRDIIINEDVTFSTLVAAASRDFTINSGKTLTSQSGMTLGAAGAFSTTMPTGTGVFTNNGTINIAGQLLISSGLDSGGNRADLTLSNTNLVTPSLSNLHLIGFRDVTFNRDITASGFITLIAGRNITVPTGITVQNGAGSNFGFTATALINLAGKINVGSGTLTLLAGPDSSGNSNDLILDTNNFSFLNTSSNGVNISGFRDVIFNRNFTTAGTIAITAGRDFIVNNNSTLNVTGGTNTLTGTRNFIVNAGSSITATGGGNTLNLIAAGNNIANTGVFINDGFITKSTGNLLIVSGLTSSGDRQDLTLENTHFNITPNDFTIQGVRDLTIADNLVATSSITFTPYRNLTIAAGKTIQSTFGMTLRAANNVTTNVGQLYNYGQIIMGTGNFSLVLNSGVDSSGNRLDLLLDNNYVTMLNNTGSGGYSFTGFRDVTVDRNLTINGALTIAAYRNITLASGRTFSAAGYNLTAANNAINNVGTITLNSPLTAGTNSFTLLSGVDGSGNRADLNINSSNFTFVGTTSAVTISGYRDITVDSNLTTQFAIQITAERNQSVTAGRILTAGSGYTTTLRAGGTNATNTGILTINGVFNVLNNSSISLFSGLDSGGNRIDFTLDSSNMTQAGATISAVFLSGFRDVLINRDLNGTWGHNIVAERNLTIGAGVLVKSTTNGTNLKAAGGVITNTGVFVNNGIINTDTNGLTISSGLDGSGQGVDITLNSSNFVQNAATIGNLILTGFRDITVDRNIVSSGNIQLLASVGSLTLNAGRSLTSGAAGNMDLRSAVALNINGTLNLGTGALTLINGTAVQDFTWDNSGKYVLQGATVGGTIILGFNDVYINRDFISNSGVSIYGNRNLTLASGMRVKAGGAGNIQLRSSGSNSTVAEGNLYLNGIIDLTAATGGLTLSSGLDSSGNRQDLVLDNSNYLQGATVGAVSIAGYRDITLNKNLISSASVSIFASRNFTISSGVTLQNGTSLGSGMNLVGGGASDNIGVLDIAGTLNLGGGLVALSTGSDSSGNRPDLVWDNSGKFLMQGASVNGFSTAGWRDVYINRDINSGQYVDLSAYRNINIASGVHIYLGTGNSFAIRAAGNTTTGIGTINNLGTVHLGGGYFTLTNGINSATGERDDLVLDGTHYLRSGAITGLSLSGFRDITLGQSFTTNSGNVIDATRNVTINAGTVLTSATNTTINAGSVFTNNAGAGALVTTGGRYLIYTADQTTSNFGNLAYDFRMFNCSYGGSCTIPAGNGFLFSGTGTGSGGGGGTFYVNGEATELPNVVIHGSYDPYTGVNTPSYEHIVDSRTAETYLPALMVDPSRFGYKRSEDMMLTFDPEIAARFRLQNWHF